MQNNSLYLVIKQKRFINKTTRELIYKEDFINLTTPYLLEVMQFLGVESEDTIKSSIKRNSIIKDKYNNYYKIEVLKEC